MKWKLPPKIKIYEALGCIGDKRIFVLENKANVYSSSKKKSYIVKYDSKTNAIMANDNGSYWKGYLGYPSIAYLMVKGIVKYSKKYAEALKNIHWKDMNVKFKNDFLKTEEYVKQIASNKDIKAEDLLIEINRIYRQIKELNINLFGKKISPPQGY